MPSEPSGFSEYWAAVSARLTRPLFDTIREMQDAQWRTAAARLRAEDQVRPEAPPRSQPASGGLDKSSERRLAAIRNGVGGAFYGSEGGRPFRWFEDDHYNELALQDADRRIKDGEDDVTIVDAIWGGSERKYRKRIQNRRRYLRRHGLA